MTDDFELKLRILQTFCSNTFNDQKYKTTWEQVSVLQIDLQAIQPKLYQSRLNYMSFVLNKKTRNAVISLPADSDTSYRLQPSFFTHYMYRYSTVTDRSS